jgi:uncharacterized protein YrzB (UPF0473 family)
MKNYKIIAYVTGDDEVYQVVDDGGNEYCRNATGSIEALAEFSKAEILYFTLTGSHKDDADERIENLHEQNPFRIFGKD